MSSFLLCFSYVMETWNRTQDQKCPVIANPWNFVTGTSIVYYQRTVLKDLSWNLSILGTAMIFIQQSNLVTSIGVHSSLHNNFHHQITFTHINLFIEYPPPYHRLIWNYYNADILNIRKSINSINWSHLFSENHIDIQVSIFEECVLTSLKILYPISMLFLTIKNLSGWSNQ